MIWNRTENKSFLYKENILRIVHYIAIFICGLILTIFIFRNLIFHLYLPLDEFDELEEFEDIKDAFFPIADVLQFAVPSIGIKLYGTNDEDVIVKDKLVFI